MEHAMPTDAVSEKKSNPEPTPTEQEPYVPKPPTPEAVEEISRQQELITDEWTGDGPDGAGEEVTHSEGGRPAQP
jgi:hypothetical protein